MKNSKGFTLLELIVVIAIMGVLAVVMVPTLTQYKSRSELGVCEANRQEFLHSYIINQSMGDSGYSLEQAINGDCPALLADKNNLKCPDKGDIKVENGALVCSVHGAIGSSGSGSGSETLVSGDKIFGDTVTLQNWETLCKTTGALPYGGTEVVMGTVYVVKGVTYVVKWKDYLHDYEANSFVSNPDGAKFLQKFNPNVTINSSSFSAGNKWTPALMNGTVFSEYDSNKKRMVSYVFLGSDNTLYESLPTQGKGYWVKLS